MWDMPASMSTDPQVAEYAEREVESVMNSYSVINAKQLKKVGWKLKWSYRNMSMPETTKHKNQKPIKLPEISWNNTLDQITTPEVQNLKSQ